MLVPVGNPTGICVNNQGEAPGDCDSAIPSRDVTSPAGWGYLLDGHMGDSVICGWREHGRGAIKPLLVLKQLRENTPGIDDQNPKMLTGTLPLVVDLSNNGLRRRT